MSYEITTKIARVRIGSDIWQSGDGILLDAISVRISEDKSASTCTFSVYDPQLLIAAKYRKISIASGGIVVSQDLLTGGKGVQQDAQPDNVQNTSISGASPNPSAPASTTKPSGNGVTYKGFPPQISAFLDVIAWGEVDDKLGAAGYHEGTGGKYIADLSKPPPGSYTDNNFFRYQMSANEWDEYWATNPPLRDCSPEAQDMMAKWKMDRQGAIAPLMRGDLIGAISAASNEWASLPNPATGVTRYKHNTAQPLSHAISYYKERLAYYQGKTPQVSGVQLNQVAAQMQPTQPSDSGKQLKTDPAPTEDTEKGTEIIIEMMVGTSDLTKLIAFHFIHVATDSIKQLGKEVTTFSGKGVKFLLTRVPQTQTYTNITLKQFAQRITTQYGLTLNMDGDGLTYHYLPQEGQTPFQVLQRECRKIGFRIADNPRTNEILIEPFAKPSFTGVVIDEETLIEAKFSDKASAVPRYIPGAIASDPEIASAGNKTSIDRQSGTTSQNQNDNKVGAGTTGGITGVKAPSVFGITLNQLAAQQAAQTANTAPSPAVVIDSPAMTSPRTSTKPDGSVVTVQYTTQTSKQYLQIIKTENTVTTIAKSGVNTTTTKKVVTTFTDTNTTITTTITPPTGSPTTTTETSPTVNNAVLGTKNIPQASTGFSSSPNVDEVTGLPKQEPGAIALARDGRVEGEALVQEKSRVKGYEGSLSLRTTEAVLQLLPGEIVGLSGRWFPSELATEVRLSDISHDFASGKSSASFYTPLQAESDTPASVQNTSIGSASGNTSAKSDPPAPKPTNGGLILPIVPSQGVGDGVGFIPSRGRPHKGVDLRAPLGTPVVASGDGVVTEVQTGCVAGDYPCGGYYGNSIVIALIVPATGEKIYSRVAHLKEGSVLVKIGDVVKQGQQIAQVGTTGHSTGPHCHCEFRRGSSYGNYFAPSTFGISCPHCQAGMV